MFKFATKVGVTALAAQLAYAAPSLTVRDSSIGDEVAVSAPFGTPITDTAELFSQTKAEAEASSSSLAAQYSAATASPYTTTAAYGSSYTSSVDSSNNYGSSMDSSNNYGYSSSSSADYNMYTSTSAAYNAYTTTSSSYNAYTTTSSADMSSSTYGSGSSNWGSNGYDNCVQQCIASFGAPPAAYTPPPSTTTDSSSSGGSGTTHTIIVAPSQGVLRYVPFATNASVGDTIKFMWNANMHTVTKSSEASLCNKTDDAPFASGVQNKSFVFTQTVNSTDPTFFYCGVPTHCQKGMFGIINPPSALTAATSVSNMLPGMITNNSDIAAMAAYTTKQTEGNIAAGSWGNSIDMATIPSAMQSLVAENVMYVRNFLALNQDVLKDDGSIDLGATNGAPLMIPQDLSAVLASETSSSAASQPTSAASTASSAAASGTTTAGATSGARGLAASSAVAGVVAFAAAVLAL